MSKSQFVQITRQPKVDEAEFYIMVSDMYQQVWESINPPQIPTHDLSDRVAGNIITPSDAPIPDCITCGGCCQAFTQVPIYPNEEISPEYYWDITVKGEKDDIVVDRFLRRNGETFACNWLGGKVGEKVDCTIYEQRPQVCRNFEAGSDKCHAVRRAFGIEPALGLMEMYYAVQKLKALPETSKNSSTEIDIVSFVEQPETGYLEIKATMLDNSTQIIHTFDPNIEKWHQYEFKGMPLDYAQGLINDRKAK